ncbi:TauD/TfdA family dioxygenase [Nonomuraea cypriaca]|uniref:TauD/TfdA family dioxygenase n=1 Tax=Nonomuraea cypriaca TaxID=1187855 RepID=UPI001A9C66CC|nr:TauD/TfdA family dioxygenase [Nonomuraea cypriaca]
MVRHPLTGRASLFNQLAFLNEWTMEPAVRDYLKLEFCEEGGLPFNMAFGDGEPLGEDLVTEINAVYDRHTVSPPWTDGDVLLVDNIAVAHNREPYRGAREMVVAMGDPVTVQPYGAAAQAPRRRLVRVPAVRALCVRAQLPSVFTMKTREDLCSR